MKIEQALGLYAGEYGHYPATLEALVSTDITDDDTLHCPAAAESRRRCDYFYMRPGGGVYYHDSKALMVCEFKAHHADERGIVFKSGVVARVSETEFQKLLARPENTEFAHALRATGIE